MTSILIRNGRIIDGTGNPWFRGDVAVQDGSIYQIGQQLDNTEGRPPDRIIDAGDKCVCPGFIDIHTHPDLAVFYKEVEDYKLRQGVTTEVAGNCGWTAAPMSPETGSLLKDFMAFMTPPSGVTWDWSTFGEYLETVQDSHPATNIAALLGHSTVRIAVMGFELRAPTAKELEQMKALVDEAMQAGAFGLSTGLTDVPATHSESPEIVELAKVASKHGGFYATHIRNEGDQLLESLREAVEIGQRAGLPVQISHHKAMGRANHGKVRESLALLERTREEGLDITADQYPYTAGSTTLQTLLPNWAQEGGIEHIVRRLRDSGTRQKIAKEVVNSQGETKIGGSLDNVFISSVASEENQRFVGLSVTQIANVRNQDPIEAALDLLVEEKCAAGMVAFSMSEDDVRMVMGHPTTMIGTDGLFSTGNPHPRLYGTYPRILGRYVRDLKLLTLEEAVRKMTSFPASKLGLGNKGVLRPGSDADIVVFDPKTVIDRATFEQAQQYPEGIEYVLVNGELAVDGGKFTGRTAGKVLAGNAK